MSRYASNTDVSVEKSQAELKRLLSRYGAEGFILGELRQQACVQFAISGRVVKFVLDMPERESREFTHTPSRGYPRDERAAWKAWEQACRQKWRALVLFVRATLEAVEEGVVDFNDAMMPFTVVAGGQTFAERYGDEVSQWIEGGNAPKRLALPGAGE